MTMRSMLSILLLLIPTLITGYFYGDTKDVHTFENKSEFETKVLKSDSIWLVQFYDPTDSSAEDFAHEYIFIAELLKGIIPLAAFDITTPENEYAISDYNINGSKSITLKLFADDKSEPIDLKSVKDTGMIVSMIMETLQETINTRAGDNNAHAGKTKKKSSSSTSGGGDGGSKKKMESRVEIITGANIAAKIYENPLVSAVAFIAPWCGHCKSLLPEWANASIKLHGAGAILGVVDATIEADLATEYDVSGFPTIKLFPGGVGKSSSSAVDYEGGREKEEIIRYMLEEVDRSGVPKEIPELTDATVMEETCVMEGSNLCVLFALPHILETGAEGRNKYREIMGEATRAVRGMSFGFAWFEGGSEQGKLENALGLNFGFPAVVAYSNKKGVYIVQRESFNVGNIRRFLTSITMGKQQAFPIDVVPVVKTVEPWDGKDGIPFEEESLEDIMGEGWDEF
eukprot:CAMPEP_0198276078 /NCGR_PEP_ID=MMETSP1447-20131203/65119_1 /TAXON_ID=420782 /ORGANISM="Chaetoceros dichaeta, Strain CCMP1751" /LENGTH=456 /DNA_ID=CAMNT_0043970997 /DNA_START=79 /DNA_END=1449 /DNA_ORIENTATION=+